MTSTQRARLRAVSGTEFAFTQTDVARSEVNGIAAHFEHAASNVTRVRSDGFSNTKAMVRRRTASLQR
jgi:hypothetical protein